MWELTSASLVSVSLACGEQTFPPSYGSFQLSANWGAGFQPATPRFRRRNVKVPQGFLSRTILSKPQLFPRPSLDSLSQFFVHGLGWVGPAIWMQGRRNCAPLRMDWLPAESCRLNTPLTLWEPPWAPGHPTGLAFSLQLWWPRQ